MTSVRPNVVLAGTQKPAPMGTYGAAKMYIRSAGRMTWAKKPMMLCNAPYTIESPHPLQAAIRVGFGSYAQYYKGLSEAEKERLKEETGLVGAASYIVGKSVKAQAREIFGGTLPAPAGRRARRSYHTINQLKAMVNRAIKKGTAAGGEFTSF